MYYKIDFGCEQIAEKNVQELSKLHYLKILI